MLQFPREGPCQRPDIRLTSVDTFWRHPFGCTTRERDCRPQKPHVHDIVQTNRDVVAKQPNLDEHTFDDVVTTDKKKKELAQFNDCKSNKSTAGSNLFDVK